MRRVESRDSYRLHFIDRPSGATMMFGLLTITVLCCVYGAHSDHWIDKNGAPMGWRVFLIAVTLFIIGVLIESYRVDLTIDKRTGVVVKKRRILGLGLPMFTSTQAFSGIRCVGVSHDIIRTDKGSYSIYPIDLRTGTDETVRICQGGNPDVARRDAEQIARFLDLPLRDSTQGQIITRRLTSGTRS